MEYRERNPTFSIYYSNSVVGVVTAKCVLWRQLTAGNWLRPFSLSRSGKISGQRTQKEIGVGETRPAAREDLEGG